MNPSLNGFMGKSKNNKKNFIIYNMSTYYFCCSNLESFNTYVLYFFLLFIVGLILIFINYNKYWKIDLIFFILFILFQRRSRSFYGSSDEDNSPSSGPEVGHSNPPINIGEPDDDDNDDNNTDDYKTDDDESDVESNGKVSSYELDLHPHYEKKLFRGFTIYKTDSDSIRDEKLAHNKFIVDSAAKQLMRGLMIYLKKMKVLNEKKMK